MLPCQKNCAAYREGCHKTCAHWPELQKCQREDQRRRKEYLRRANEACRMSLHLCWQAGGYLGVQSGH